jgi:acetylglutamate synthase
VSTKSEDLQIIEPRLKALLDCILDKATEDLSFAKQLRASLEIVPDKVSSDAMETVQLTPSVVQPAIENADNNPTVEQTNAAKSTLAASSQPSKGKKKKTGLSPVTYLYEHGEEALREKLALEASSELSQILRSEGIRKGKFKITDRKKTIDDIVQYAIRQLNKGSVFL